MTREVIGHFASTIHHHRRKRLLMGLRPGLHLAYKKLLAY